MLGLVKKHNNANILLQLITTLKSKNGAENTKILLDKGFQDLTSINGGEEAIQRELLYKVRNEKQASKDPSTYWET